jgi:hypothetical protein
MRPAHCTCGKDGLGGTQRQITAQRPRCADPGESALGVPLAAIADEHDQDAFVESSLAAAAERNPDALLRVILQGSDSSDTGRVADEVSDRLDDDSSSRDAVTGRFESINGVAATLTGEQVLDLARDGAIQAITSDVPMVASSLTAKHWPQETGLHPGSTRPGWIR